jgi:hypothetical protein
MHRIIGIIGIMSGFGVLLSALCIAIPYFSESHWYSNQVFWLLAALTAVAAALIALAGNRVIRNPTRRNAEASAFISALIITSAVRVIFIEKIENSAGRLIGSIISALLVFLVFYIATRRIKNENEANQ